MIDTTTKVILAMIALGLFANAVAPLLHPVPVSAQRSSSFSCSGKINVNAWGSDKPTIGGYNVNLDCQ
jgi:hypothetical protein